MPTYQYVCSSCNEPHEAVQSFSDDALTLCPACGKHELRKVYGSVGVVFKGSGFYRNDSRGSSTTTTPATTSSGTADSGSSSSTTTPASTSPAATSTSTSTTSTASSN